MAAITDKASAGQAADDLLQVLFPEGQPKQDVSAAPRPERVVSDDREQAPESTGEAPRSTRGGGGVPGGLVLYKSYTREEVHHLFAPGTPFVPKTGTWGLHGIVKVPQRKRDYVFFVTFGKKQGRHRFREGITQSGLLTWQSQPGQGLQERRILDFLSHDYTTDNIYLFLRALASGPYTYLGRLAYVSHDPTMERPVHFVWRILDWSLPESVARNLRLVIEPDVGRPAAQKGRGNTTTTSPVQPRRILNAGQSKSVGSRLEIDDPMRLAHSNPSTVARTTEERSEMPEEADRISSPATVQPSLRQHVNSGPTSQRKPDNIDWAKLFWYAIVAWVVYSAIQAIGG